MRGVPIPALATLAACLLGAAPKPAPSLAAPAPVIEPAGLKALKARAIGPAVMGGRVSEIALDPVDPDTYYVALGTGGLMKTSDDGDSFQAVFERGAVAGVGAVAVAASDPKVVWLGTGEANDRNSSAWGDGVYRSTDAGTNWSHVGLKDSRAIARIVVHPTDPRTAWAAVAGDLWVASPERGLFKTTDAGATWRAVLTAPAPYSDRVGCGDVVLDPQNPQVLYAALYARQRTPWSFSSGPALTDGKDLGGIFKSSDGGATWRKLAGGLPAATGRIGLALSAKNPSVVYAVVQSWAGGTSDIDDILSKRGGVFRSEDGGESFARMSALDPRPFYFSQIRVDPENDRRIYVLGFALHVSEDGGRTYREDRFEKVHADCHALAIDPRRPQRVLLGTDGGLYRSHNGGENWAHVSRFAGGEFYRIAVDSSTPYRVCGGLQDNLNWVGPSRTQSKEGILNGDWINIEGGDGFYCHFDADDPDLLFAESQQGDVHRFDLKTGAVKRLRPSPAEGQPRFRFNWNAPLVGSRHAKDVLYLAGNRVFRLTSHGEEWQAISPDLSAQDPARTATVGSGAETYGVVYAFGESPRRAGLLWAGTDDGKLWLTEDDGGHWTDLTGSLPPQVTGQWLSRIEPGAQDENVAYLAVDAHRSGRLEPLAFRTADKGRTWQTVAGDLPPKGPVKLIREDPANPDLLFAGTEFGLFVSFDRGGHWRPLGELPTVAVDDILVHPRDRDLIAATHGRSLYVIDDIRCLEEVKPDLLAKEAFLFEPRRALGLNLLPGWAESAGTTGVFRGENPPEGVTFTLWVREFSGDPVKLVIKNALGQPVANLKAAGTPGFLRLTWDLKPTKDVMTEYGGLGSKFVQPGVYDVELSYGKVRQVQKLTVDVAPGIETR